MRFDLVFGFGAFSTLVVLVGLDMALALIEYKGQVASTALLRSLRTPRGPLGRK